MINITATAVVKPFGRFCITATAATYDGNFKVTRDINIHARYTSKIERLSINVLINQYADSHLY